MKVQFDMSVVVDARSIEDVLTAVASHISTVARHVASDRKIEDCGAQFKLSFASEDAPAADLKKDAALDKHGPIIATPAPQS